MSTCVEHIQVEGKLSKQLGVSPAGTTFWRKNKFVSTVTKKSCGNRGGGSSRVGGINKLLKNKKRVQLRKAAGARRIRERAIRGAELLTVSEHATYQHHPSAQVALDYHGTEDAVSEMTAPPASQTIGNSATFRVAKRLRRGRLKKGRPSEDLWNCQACTLLNGSCDTICRICNEPKPSHPFAQEDFHAIISDDLASETSFVLVQGDNADAVSEAGFSTASFVVLDDDAQSESAFSTTSFALAAPSESGFSTTSFAKVVAGPAQSAAPSESSFALVDDVEESAHPEQDAKATE